MRENRPYGSEGGAARKGRPYPYQDDPSVCGVGKPRFPAKLPAHAQTRRPAD